MKRFTLSAIAVAIALGGSAAAIAAETATTPAASVNKKETPGEYVDDAAITAKVKAAFFAGQQCSTRSNADAFSLGYRSAGRHPNSEDLIESSLGRCRLLHPQRHEPVRRPQVK